MFIFSFRFSAKKVLAGMLVVAVVAVLGIKGAEMIMGGTVEASTTEFSGTNVKLKTNEARVAFAQSFGWEVQNDPGEILEVIIPQEFDEIYQQYNSIQKQQGYDLEKYAGKRCKRYTYTVTNYPQTDKEVRLNILIYNDKVIGGDVCSLEVDGFLHGFSMEGAQSPA